MKPNIQVWPIEALQPYDKNVKTHDDAQVKKIAASIKEFGWSQPIVVDKDGVIIAGHGRRLASIMLGLHEVPVWVRDDLAPDAVRALRLADNKVAESKVDTELFRQELADLDYDLGSFFDEKELNFALADLGEVNLDAFVSDVGAAVKSQDQAVQTAADAANDKPVPIARVFGFKQVRGGNQLAITKLIAHIEASTGLKGEAALVAYSERLAV